MEHILLDIGSSTIKPYKLHQNKLIHLQDKSIFFKKNFKDGHLDDTDIKDLINFIRRLQREYPSEKFKAYATSIFRDLKEENKNLVIEQLYNQTGVLLNIIDQVSESIYLQIALTGMFKTKKNLLLINIGGGSTELVVLNNNKLVERVNIKIGVGTILSTFPNINNEFSGVPLEAVVSYVNKNLPSLTHNPKIAFYTGGELDYMQKTKYPLKANKLFKDALHPSIIDTKDFSIKNDEVFNSLSIKDLENLMPLNPKWMHGARACSALAQAICEKYKVSTIIPSNVNLIDGIVRYENNRKENLE